ncbi:MAG: protein kinase [Candidatus Competibacteraceae bacterium]|nr:protein kinase [Candidatus Competibacteraceae bacterium]
MQSGERIVINGRDYRLDNVLSTGAGSYGQVWAATDAVGYPVALKLINTLAMEQADPSLQGHWRAHLEREIAFLSRLSSEQSRHIVTLLDHGQLDGQPVLVMEQLSANLGQWLAQKRQDSAPPLALERILDWAGQILSGLEVIHDAGFVYRDLKFSNILVDQDGALLKLADFGSLKRHDGDSTRSFIGTPATMAPEQALPASTGAEGYEYAVGPRADYYALGLLLFTLLTDQPATAAQRRLGQLLAQHGQEGAAQRCEELGELNDQERKLLQRSIEFWTIPVSTQPGGGTATLLADLITRLLARNPDDRPENATEIRAVLDAVRAGQLIACNHEPKPVLAADEPNWDISPLTLPPNPRSRRLTAVNRPGYSRSTKTLVGILALAGALAWAIALRPSDSPSLPVTPEPAVTIATQETSEPSKPVVEDLSVENAPLPAAEPRPVLVTDEEAPEPPEAGMETLSDAENLDSPPPRAEEHVQEQVVIAKPQAKPAAPAESEPSVMHRSSPTTAKVAAPKPRQERIAKPAARTDQAVKTIPSSSPPASRPAPIATPRTPVATPAAPVARVEPRSKRAAPPALPPIELKSRLRSTPPTLPPIELTARSQPARPTLPPIELTSRQQSTSSTLPPIQLVSRTDPKSTTASVQRSRSTPAPTPVASTARSQPKPVRHAATSRKPARRTANPITQFQKDAARAATQIRRGMEEFTKQVSRTGASVGVEIERGLKDVEQVLTYNNNNNAARVERRDRPSPQYVNPPPRRLR